MSRKDRSHWPIVFQHIPKTAGVSVRSVIAQNYWTREILHVPDSRWRDHDYAHDVIKQYRFIHGHIHADFLSKIRTQVRAVTFLRNPVERVLSLYFFLRKQDPQKETSEHARYIIELAHTLSIVDFFASEDRDLDSVVSNYQIQIFLDQQQNDRPIETWVAAAINVVQRYEFVGLSDPDWIVPSIARMAQLFGWVEPRDAPLVNRTERTAEPAEITRAIGLIRERNTVDLEFYNLVRSRFLDESAVPSPIKSMSAMAARRQRSHYQTGMISPVTLEQPLRCWGWYDREEDATGLTWRCAGELTAGFELKIGAESRTILCLEMMTVSQQLDVPMTTVSVSKKGAKCAAFLSGNKWFLAILVQPEWIDGEGIISVELSFHVCEEVTTPDDYIDDRVVFLALEKIDILTGSEIGNRNVGIFFDQLLAHRAAVDTTVELKSLINKLQSARQAENANALMEISAQKIRAERAEDYCRSLAQEVDRLKLELSTARLPKKKTKANG